MQNEAQPRQKPLTYGSTRPVDELDRYSLERAREELLKTVEITTSGLTAPVVRDINSFFLRFEDVRNEQKGLGDPWQYTCQVILGLVDLKGWKYVALTKLSRAEPPTGYQGRQEENTIADQRAGEELDELLEEQHRQQTPSFLNWPDDARSGAGDFAGYLQCARQLLRRYPALVKAETFPQPFRYAREQALGCGPENDPDQELADYGDLSLIKEGLLLCLDRRVEQAANEGTKQQKEPRRPGQEGATSGEQSAVRRAARASSSRSLDKEPDREAKHAAFAGRTKPRRGRHMLVHRAGRRRGRKHTKSLKPSGWMGRIAQTAPLVRPQRPPIYVHNPEVYQPPLRYEAAVPYSAASSHFQCKVCDS